MSHNGSTVINGKNQSVIQELKLTMIYNVVILVIKWGGHRSNENLPYSMDCFYVTG
jgi:hypothetical protein